VNLDKLIYRKLGLSERLSLRICDIFNETNYIRNIDIVQGFKENH
jgi:hypothetical protein